MALNPNKNIEPPGNLPERSIAGSRIIWWALAVVVVLLFCLLAWFIHGGG